MKFLKTSLLAAVSFFSLASIAQTADEIVNKHIEAVGGREKLSQIKSVVLQSSMDVMGNSAPMTVTILNGKGYKSEVDFNGQKIVQAFTDKGGWSINPMTGATDAQPMPADQFSAGKSQINVGGPLFDYAARGSKIELAGKEKVGDVDAFKLQLTSADNKVSTYYIDPTTYYLVKTVMTLNMGGQEGEVSVTFSDYRKTDVGYVLPYAISTTLSQGFTMDATVNKVDINTEVDPKIFEMPQ